MAVLTFLVMKFLSLIFFGALQNTEVEVPAQCSYLTALALMGENVDSDN